MLEVLYEVEKDLLKLLEDENAWQSVDINYESPRVERLWRQYGEHRINLHCIHRCKPGMPLFHPHPWPSAMRVLGEYEMGVGYGTGIVPPPIAARIMLQKDSAYEMTDPDAWHYVRPTKRVAFSLMVTGRPWSRLGPKSDKPLKPLTADRCKVMFVVFRAFYKIPDRYLPPTKEDLEADLKWDL